VAARLTGNLSHEGGSEDAEGGEPERLGAVHLFNQRIIGVRTSNAAAKDRLWQLVVENALRPLVDSVVPLEEVADAHRRIEADHNIGRVVLAV
jgi:NADPH:quinone reductase